MRDRTPRLARLLVTLSTRREDRPSLLRDLDEEFESMLCEGTSAADARRWYWRQAVSSHWPSASRRQDPFGTPRYLFRSEGGVLRDLRIAARMLRKRPGFSLLVVLTLALGIGTTSAVFSLVRGVLLTPPPYDDPGRLVLVTPQSVAGSEDPVPSWTANHWLGWGDEADLFETIAAYSWTDHFLVSEFGSQSLGGMRVSKNYFELTGLKPVLGRAFEPSEVSRGAETPSVIISHDLWLRRFGGDPNVLGRPLRLSGESTPPLIIGVMPPDVRFLPSPRHAQELNYDVDAKVDFWLPHSVDFSGPVPPVLRALPLWDVVGRLRSGVTVDQAEAQLARIAEREAQENPNYAGVGVRVEPLLEVLNAPGRRVLLPLMATSGLVLLIGCGNAAALFLVRGQNRRQEYAVRSALGAGRATLLRIVMTESILLVLIGGASGIGLAVGLVRGFKLIAGHAVPRLDAVSTGWPLLFFGLGVALVAIVAAALYPAVRASPDSGAEVVSAGAARATSTRAERRFLMGVTVIQVATTFTLLVAAGLLIRTMYNIALIDPGYETGGLLTMSVTAVHGDPLEFHARALEAVQAVPAVEGAAFVWGLPLTGSYSALAIEIEGAPPPGNLSGLRPVKMGHVSTGYFEHLGQSVVRGRDIRASDDLATTPVVVVNEAFVERYLGTSAVLGRRITVPVRIAGVPSQEQAPHFQIVGVVPDGRTNALTQRAEPEMYGSIWQASEISELGSFSKHLVVRTAGDAGTSAVGVERALRSIEPTVAVEDIKTMQQIQGESVAARTFATLLLLAFAGVACVLTMGGLYGMMSMSIVARFREFAIRTAVGASKGVVLVLVLKEGMAVIAAGVAVGFVASIGLGRVLSSLLFEVEPMDLLTLAVMGSLFVGVALAACWFPARRAADADPVTALRGQ